MDNLTDTAQGDTFSGLQAIITELIGPDVAQIVGIRRDSTFSNDLEMDSIQIVSFSEKVHERFGDQVDFVTWLSHRPLESLISLTVGDVADLIDNGL
ncbi:MAG: phosphopantetheine-binding protein [Coriobacteriales bacterium]|jgi:acyl carrier protein|nr:phosphopantetheine-binding protein [Coriobacteriales bacterium]